MDLDTARSLFARAGDASLEVRTLREAGRCALKALDQAKGEGDKPPATGDAPKPKPKRKYKKRKYKPEEAAARRLASLAERRAAVLEASRSTTEE